MTVTALPQRWHLSLGPPWALSSFAAIYFCCALAGNELTLAPELGVALWPPSGLLAAMLLRSHPRQYPIWLGAAGLADVSASLLIYQFPLTIALPIAFGNCLEGLVAAVLLRKWAGGDFALCDVRSAVAFGFFAGCLAPIMSMLFGGTVVGIHTGTTLSVSWRLWWTGDAVGMLVVAPLVMSMRSEAWRYLRSAGYVRHGDFAALVSVLVILGYLCLGGPYPVAFAVMPAVLWATLRHGFAGSSLAVGMTVIQAVLYAAAGRGPFLATLSMADAQTTLQGFGMVTAMTGLVLAGAAAQVRNTRLQMESVIALRTQQLEAREAALSQAVAQLEVVDRRKDRFVATLAHEILNPLAALRTGVTLLERGVTVTKAGPVSSMLSRQVEQLTTIGSDLLDLSRIKTGKTSLRMVRVPIAEVVANASESVEAQMRAKSQVLIQDNIVADATVCGDPQRLTQIVVNLLTNASRHCPHGATVRVRAFHVGSNECAIEVADNGPGIAPDRIESVFGIYEQVGDATAGLGIGLALVKQLVELHGGRVAVVSEPGAGAVFTVTLKLSEETGAGVQGS